MSSFYARPEDVSADSLVLRDEEAHHAIQVRRCQVGEEVEVIDGVGMLYRVRIIDVLRNEVVCRIAAQAPEHGEPRARVTLVPSLIKGDRFDLLVEKATEMGVSEIVPMVAERTIGASRSGRRLERWARIAHAATKQSGRCRVPMIRAPRKFEDVLEVTRTTCDLRTIACVEERSHTVRDRTRAVVGVSSVAIFTGPEGGFTDREIQLARGAGVLPISLGKRRLRSETAGMMAVALMVDELEAGDRRQEAGDRRQEAGDRR